MRELPINLDALDSGVFDVAVTVYVRRPTESNERGYLSAYTTYGKKPGEDWNRGNDLADGPANAETLERIARDLADVVEGNRR